MIHEVEALLDMDGDNAVPATEEGIIDQGMHGERCRD
jgi:hypothetical protein